jgi:hypothetical protein
VWKEKKRDPPVGHAAGTSPNRLAGVHADIARQVGWHACMHAFVLLRPSHSMKSPCMQVMEADPTVLTTAAATPTLHRLVAAVADAPLAGAADAARQLAAQARLDDAGAAADPLASSSPSWSRAAVTCLRALVSHTGPSLAGSPQRGSLANLLHPPPWSAPSTLRNAVPIGALRFGSGTTLKDDDDVADDPQLQQQPQQQRASSSPPRMHRALHSATNVLFLK